MKRFLFIVLVFASLIVGITPMPAMDSSFAHFEQRAAAGDSLTVVFFGCSLTWGANSTDPGLRSYRAHIARRLAERYPKAHWTFVDAAIGGTDSRLGIFRFERDVAAHHPDLVFVDFTLNDDPLMNDEDHLGSYEAIINRCVSDLHVPTVAALLCAKGMVGCLDLTRFKRRTAHLAIADAYGCAVGDAFATMQALHRAGKLDLDAAWDNPVDTIHPGDLGYQLYADAIWDGYLDGLRRGLVGHQPPQPLHGETYRTTVRARLAELVPLPGQWQAAQPTRISAWYDSLMSRWLDTEAKASWTAAAVLPAAWELNFRGSTVLLFGESTVTSGRLRVLIDSQPASELSDGILDCRSGCAGTVKLSVALAVGLAPGEHRLRLEPLPPLTGSVAEWRIESICVAGAGAGVWH